MTDRPIAASTIAQTRRPVQFPTLARVLALILAPAAGLPLAATAARAQDKPLLHDLGTRHRFEQPPGSPHLPVGCKDHRTLMFVVRGIESDDPASAQMLSQRDCRPLVPDAQYIRCGPGGWAYPSKGERLTYASYCRIGANDLPFYVLDQQMPLIEGGSDPAR
jgi:hypothetical protein